MAQVTSRATSAVTTMLQHSIRVCIKPDLAKDNRGMLTLNKATGKMEWFLPHVPPKNLKAERVMCYVDQKVYEV